MKLFRIWLFLCLPALLAASVFGQVSVALPGRSLAKLLPDYARPRVYALNKANGSVPGTLLALNSTNGAILNEISVNLNPTDMAMTPSGDSLYVIHAGSRTISKVDLTTFTVLAEKAISTPNTYSLANPLYVVARQSGNLFYTDGAWGPEVYFFDFNAGTNMLVLNTGGNQDFGAGAMILNRSGDTLYVWKQYGWSAGNVNSWVTRYAASTNGTLTPLEDSFSSWRRDPLDTPLFLDGAERWVFNKEQMFASTNVTVLVNQFSDNLYGISLDGSVAFGPTEVFNTRNGTTLTNLSFSTTVQSLSGDQKRLFRWNASTTSVVIYDMTAIAALSGPSPVPTPADGAVVSLPLTNLSWTVSPFALAYDVYFGTNQSQVASASPGSIQYLGRVTSPAQPLNQSLLPGTNYFWRVDVVGFSATNTGPVWAFTPSSVSINPSQISYFSIAGYNPAGLTLSLTSAAPVAWSASVTGPNWLALNVNSGTSPTNVAASFTTAALAAGQYTNNIEFTVGGLKLEVPVTLTIRALNITKMVGDRQRPYLYAIQPPPLSGQNGLLLFINSTNGNVDKSLTIGINPVDLSINYQENRLYIASWTETWTYVVDLGTQTLLPSLNLGTDVYKINAGRAGRVVTEGQNQWIYVNVWDTTTGTSLSSGLIREGDGEADPTGTIYYHCDNNISSASVHKYIMTNDSLNEVAGSYQHPYGTRNLVLSGDGTTLFWNSYVYDANLTELGTLGAEIYSCSTNGRVAFSGSQAFDSSTRLAIYNLPVTTSISTVDGQNQRFWYFNTGNATLGSIPMSVIQSPSITQQPPASTSVAVGGSSYWTVTAMGIAPLAYQWTTFGTNIAGATNYFLSMTGIQPARQGDYQAVVSNPFGSVTSTVAHLTVLVPPGITSLSPNTNISAGQSFSLAVTAAGTSPFTYRWMFENTTISGAVNPILTIANAQSANEGIYSVAVANAAGSVTSAVVSVRILPAAPTIVSNPVSLFLPASSNATFRVTALGSQPLGYRWSLNGAVIAGATSSQYSIAGVQSSNSGSYVVVVTNSVGSATSSVATLTVTPLAPYFVLQPVGAALSAGSSRTLTAQANGSQPITYQWQRNSTNLSGSTQTSLALNNLAVADSGSYAVLASNIGGVSTSAVAQITVYQNPTLMQGLSNQVVDISSTVLLAVNVLGSPTLFYSWQLNGQPLLANGATLSLTNIQLSQAGYYRVTVTNQYGSVSSTGRVSVLGWPSVVSAWGDNSGGQTNVPADLKNIIAVAGGDYHSTALRHDGTLVAWGYNGDGQTSVPTNALRFVSLASGSAHNLAITETGSGVAWGRNEAGQCNIPAAASSGLLTVAAGDSHSLALLSSGSVVAWGDNSFGQSSVPQGLGVVSAIAAGREHSLALRTNGSVAGWGYNAYGQASPPALSNAVAIAAGYLHSLALLSNGTVVVWGDNSFGQINMMPAGLANVVAVSAGDFHCLALRSDGTLVGWGNSSYGQLILPPGTTNAWAVASGNYHGLALTQVPGPLQVSLDALRHLVVRWSGPGTLQWAQTPNGPYFDMGFQGTSYTNLDMSAPAKFFRLRR